MKLYTLFSLVLSILVSTSLLAQPTISSFTPASGTPGSNLTITGTNFNATASSNTVWLGGVKATVTAASSTSLTVTVPAGATHSLIKVTTGGLTAFSAKPFFLVSPAGGSTITAASFVGGKNLPAPDFNSYATIADFNNDGKADIASIGTNPAYKMFVLRNISTSGIPSFEKEPEFQAIETPSAIESGDLNGDGKLDIVVTSSTPAPSMVSIFLNTTSSSGGAITFASRQDISLGTKRPDAIEIYDMTGDGKPDILLAITSGGTGLTILTNTTTNASTFTHTSADFALPSANNNWKLVVGDYDGDGKGDVAVANTSANTVYVLRNTTTAGTISFAASVNLTAASGLNDVTMGDINDDGKVDIITSSQTASPYTVSVFRNTSSGATNIAFATKVDFTYAARKARSVVVHDIDGDAKLDVLASEFVLKNTSSGGTISFQPAVTVFSTTELNSLAAFAVDLTGDGIAEIVNCSLTSSMIVQSYRPVPTITSFNPTSARVGEAVTILGSNLSYLTGIKFGTGQVITSFTVNSPTSVTAFVSDGNSGDVAVINEAGQATKSGFTLIAAPKVTSFSPEKGPIGTTVTITGTGFSTTLADNRVYFGSVRATITEASATTLKVTVPAGFSEVPLTVGVASVVGTAIRPFRVTFAGGNAPFDAKSMSAPIKTASDLYTYSPAIGDFNNDNKPDIVSVGPNSVLVYLNTTANGLVTIGTSIPLAQATQPNDVAVADVDGDGLQDIISSGVKLSVFRNTSTGANTTFAAPVQFDIVSNHLVVADIDSDGRPDVVSGGPTFVSRNISYAGTIKFAAYYYLPGGVSTNAPTAIADLDQDGRPEIVAHDYLLNKVLIYPNFSTPGSLSIITPLQLGTITAPDFVTIADMDGNNRPEVIVLSKSTGKAAIIFNGSTMGLAFSPSESINIGDMNFSGDAALGDINGDANPDIALANNFSFINLMKNNTPVDGNYKFETFSNITGLNNYSITDPVLVDFDGNGKLDIVGSKGGGTGPSVTHNLTILRNQINEPVITSFSPLRAGTGATVTITGSNFTSVTAVSFGGTPAASFEVVSETEIKAVLAAGASGAVSVGAGSSVTARDGFSFFNGPVITSFEPIGAKTGASVTIKGFKFDPTAANNIVRFGAARAEITSASATELVVKVPSGAVAGTISVTVGGIVIESPKSFIPTHSILTSAESIAFSKTDFPSSATGGLTIGDFDDDGKVDIAGTNAATNKVVILRNKAAGFVPAFDDKVEFMVGTTPEGLAAGDIDGDGKLDLVVANSSDNTVSVLKNTSTSGTLSFAAKTDFPTFTNPQAIAIGDLDRDGKLDIAVAPYHGSGTVSILLNTTTGGTISFAPKVDIIAGAFASAIAIGDVTGDQAPDVIVGSQTTSKIGVFISRSAPGTLSFLARKDYNLSGSPVSISIGDFSHDDQNTNDIVVIGEKTAGGSVDVYNGAGAEGTSTRYTEYGTDIKLKPGAIGDLSGDGYLDLVSPSGSSTAHYRRGNFLNTGKNFTVGSNPISAAIADFNGDGIPDFITLNSTSISVMQSLVPVIKSFEPTSGTTGTVVTINGSNFTGTTVVRFGVQAASAFTVESPTTIKATVGNASSGTPTVDVNILTPVAPVSLAGFTFISVVPPTISSFNPNSASTGVDVTINGTNFNGATAVSFGGVAAQSFTVVSASIITAKVGTGATGKVKVTTPAGSAEVDGFTFLSEITGLEPDFTTDLYAFEVYPNPSNGNEFGFRLHDSWNGKTVSLTITDMVGRNFASEQVVVRSVNRWSGQVLNSGIYFVSINLNEKRVVKKILVTR